MLHGSGSTIWVNILNCQIFYKIYNFGSVTFYINEYNNMYNSLVTCKIVIRKNELQFNNCFYYVYVVCINIKCSPTALKHEYMKPYIV